MKVTALVFQHLEKSVKTYKNCGFFIICRLGFFLDCRENGCKTNMWHKDVYINYAEYSSDFQFDKWSKICDEIIIDDFSIRQLESAVSWYSLCTPKQDVVNRDNRLEPKNFLRSCGNHIAEWSDRFSPPENLYPHTFEIHLVSTIKFVDGESVCARANVWLSERH